MQLYGQASDKRSSGFNIMRSGPYPCIESPSNHLINYLTYLTYLTYPCIESSSNDHTYEEWDADATVHGKA